MIGRVFFFFLMCLKQVFWLSLMVKILYSNTRRCNGFIHFETTTSSLMSSRPAEPSGSCAFRSALYLYIWWYYPLLYSRCTYTYTYGGRRNRMILISSGRLIGKRNTTWIRLSVFLIRTSRKDRYRIRYIAVYIYLPTYLYSICIS